MGSHLATCFTGFQRGLRTRCMAVVFSSGARQAFESLELSLHRIDPAVVTLCLIGTLDPHAVAQGCTFQGFLESSVCLYTVDGGGVRTDLCGHQLSGRLRSGTCAEYVRLTRNAEGQWRTLVATSQGMTLPHGLEGLTRCLAEGAWLVKQSAAELQYGDRINVTRSPPPPLSR